MLRNAGVFIFAFVAVEVQRNMRGARYNWTSFTLKNFAAIVPHFKIINSVLCYEDMPINLVAN
jgi:hypothetical protein